MAAIDMKMALNSEILALGHSDAAVHRTMPTLVQEPTVKAHSKSIANKSNTEWNMGSTGGPGGTFQEHWPSHLPRPPSRKNLLADDSGTGSGASNIPQVIVFNANTQEGSSMVRVLSEKGLRVVAVIRVFTSKNAKSLIKLKGVTVRVADLNNIDAVIGAAKDCQQAFLVTKYWERFESHIEEGMAKVVLDGCSQVGVKRLVLATFEDTRELRLRGVKSQIRPTADGRIFPSFEAMDSIHAMAKHCGVQITHMLTSYLDEADSKKSLILIRGEDGKIISQPYIQDTSKK
jgi:hypothetical protein